MEQFLAGVISGGTATLILHPLDLLKTRYQLNEKTRNTGIRNNIKNIYMQNGIINGLYRGLPANIMGSTFSWGLYFLGYEYLKKQVSNYRGQLSSIDYLFCSAVAGTCTASITNPFWMVKTRVCGQDYNNPNSYKSTLGTRFLIQILDAFRRIFVEEGVRGFYRGFLAGLLGVSHGAVHFMVYENLKKMRKKLRQTETPDTIEVMVMSLISKITASSTTYPYQVIRSRIQNRIDNEARIMTVAYNIYSKEGLLGFFKGLAPGILRVLPATCITFVLYERIIQALTK
ncbi:mitochondrial folate transporter-like protein/carrier [Rozella allomycis CSF55]|uniref:Mitochondrial folate transporter-like protein/carrier n=1 Tax=Rozella allomycis (strain CSF55) TaxID=988480 RepID=A0A075AQH1_ROZAC|nr:Mitochondrial substrate/solute carrier domain-containing protein [Rozella allomycis CSF55]RKP19937.1 mitochondrial folate transporter-like protein/carrier [Rozella allomycis CSF55]|eukprot:EPZ32410.1 Mitochondrial substrate/solute carrier domain-containing protein [Rozella allomycis CSF55]